MYILCVHVSHGCVCVGVCVCVEGGGGRKVRVEKEGERDSSRVWEALVSVISAWLLNVCIGFV